MYTEVWKHLSPSAACKQIIADHSRFKGCWFPSAYPSTPCSIAHRAAVAHTFSFWILALTQEQFRPAEKMPRGNETTNLHHTSGKYPCFPVDFSVIFHSANPLSLDFRHRHAPWSRFLILLASSTASWRTSWGDRNSLNLGFIGSTEDSKSAPKTVGDLRAQLMGKTLTLQIEHVWEQPIVQSTASRFQILGWPFLEHKPLSLFLSTIKLPP